MKTLIAIFTSLVMMMVASAVSAGGHGLDEKKAMAIVKPFYDRLSGKASAADVGKNFVSDWRSYNSNDSYKTLDETMKSVDFFLKTIPNLSWDIQELRVSGDDMIIVRSRASGSPKGDTFFGAPIKPGSSFKIMTIDLHFVKNGKVYKTYHVEDWASSLQQLAKK